MVIVKLCSIAVITAICAIILKTHNSNLTSLCITAGGLLLLLYSFDYLAESVQLIKDFISLTNIDSSIIRIIIKVVGVGYLIELTAGAVKDMGCEAIADKLILCGKFIIFILGVPILRALFNVISSLIQLV